MNLKFRAWHIKDEVMRTVTVIDFWENDIVVIIPGVGQTVMPMSEFILYEYTGIYDKHEMELIEGDIVRYKDKLFKITKGYGSFLLVKVHDETDMYEIFEDCWNDNVYPLSQFIWNHDNFDEVLNVVRVGDIHRNGDLLQ